MLLEYDDNLDTTRSTQLSIVQAIVFPFWVNRTVSPFSTHMNIPVLSKACEAIESLAFFFFFEYCTVTNRSRSRTETGAYSFICTAPGRGKSHMGFLDLLKVSIVSELKSPCSALCIEAPEYTINISNFVSLAVSQENKK